MKKNLILSLIAIFAANIANAQYGETGRTRARSSIDSSGRDVQRGFAGYLGLGVGYTGYNSNIDVEGAPATLKLLGSYVTPGGQGAFDAGYGIISQTFFQNSAADTSISTGVLELAARYQFESRWQLGAVYNQLFDKGSSYGANQADVEFGGVQLLREFSFSKNFLGRVGGRIVTSLNVDSESINMAMIDFQIGWGGASQVNSMALN